MGRTVKDSRLDTREARLKLKERADREPYWRLIHQGLHLGYRKTSSGGVWLVRTRDNEKYSKKVIGQADDYQDSNGETILSFKEAQAIAIAYNAPTYSAKTLTVKEATERYIEWFKNNRKSLKNTLIAIEAHIIPAFDKKLVSELKTKDIKEWLEKLATTPARKRSRMGEDLSYQDNPQTIDQKRARKSSANRMLTILKAILNKAYYDELVDDNTAWKRVKPFENADEPIVRFLTEGECGRLINTCEPNFRLLVKAALFTGARYGELSNLKFEDVNLETSQIFIRPSKSGKGRHIPLSDEGLDFFESLTIGKCYGDVVFTRSDGSVWGKDYQHRPLKEACDKAKINPTIGFHELRHTYASLLAQRGADLLTISKLLGHADTRITSRHYAHLCDKTLANTVKSLLPDFGHQRDNINITKLTKRKTKKNN